MSRPLGYSGDPWGPMIDQMEVPFPRPTVRTFAPKLRPKSLREALPDDPNFRRYIPIEYRLDAKRIVGDLAQDLQRGRSAHIWTEVAHFGLEAAEIIAETSTLIGALALTGPILAGVANILALGLPYQEAAEKIAIEHSAGGYSRAVVMGANRRSARLLLEYYGYREFSSYNWAGGNRVAKANFNAGLVAGYVQGRALSKNQQNLFFGDLGRRMGDQSDRGPQSQWRSKDYRSWYFDIAVAFRQYHLTA